MIVGEVFQNQDEQMEIQLDMASRFSSGEDGVTVQCTVTNELDGSDSTSEVILIAPTISGTRISQWITGSGQGYEQHVLYFIVTGDQSGIYRDEIRLIRNFNNRYL